MVNKVGDLWDGIALYEDPSMEDDRILRGRKENNSTFIVANPKTSKFIYQGFIKRIRREKLLKINNNA